MGSRNAVPAPQWPWYGGSGAAAHDFHAWPPLQGRHRHPWPAGLVPWWLTGWQARQPRPYWALLRVAGAALIAAGASVLVHAFVQFVREGLGTPAPVAPPERLVVGGLYRYVRNPMYLAVVATILGQALVLGQPVLLWYAVAVGATAGAFVRWYEEPTLRRRFGARYEAYRHAVPAWWPRLRPWEPHEIDQP